MSSALPSSASSLLVNPGFSKTPVHPRHIHLIQPCLCVAPLFLSSALGDPDRLPSLQLLLPPFSFPSNDSFSSLLRSSRQPPSDISSKSSSSLVLVVGNLSSLFASRSRWTLQKLVVVRSLRSEENLDSMSHPRWRGRLGVSLDWLHAGNGYQSTCSKDAVEHND